MTRMSAHMRLHIRSKHPDYLEEYMEIVERKKAENDKRMAEVENKERRAQKEESIEENESDTGKDLENDEYPLSKFQHKNKKQKETEQDDHKNDPSGKDTEINGSKLKGSDKKKPVEMLQSESHKMGPPSNLQDSRKEARKSKDTSASNEEPSAKLQGKLDVKSAKKMAKKKEECNVSQKENESPQQSNNETETGLRRGSEKRWTEYTANESSAQSDSEMLRSKMTAKRLPLDEGTDIDSESDILKSTRRKFKQNKQKSSTESTENESSEENGMEVAIRKSRSKSDPTINVTQSPKIQDMISFGGSPARSPGRSVDDNVRFPNGVSLREFSVQMEKMSREDIRKQGSKKGVKMERRKERATKEKELETDDSYTDFYEDQTESDFDSISGVESEGGGEVRGDESKGG